MRHESLAARYFRQQGARLGETDLWLTTRDRHDDLVSAAVRALVEIEGDGRFDGVRLILPAGLEFVAQLESVRESMPSTIPPIEIVSTSTRELDALVLAVRGAPPRFAVVCAHAELYASHEFDEGAPLLVSHSPSGTVIHHQRATMRRAIALSCTGKALRVATNASPCYALCVVGSGSLAEDTTRVFDGFDGVLTVASTPTADEFVSHVRSWSLLAASGVPLEFVRTAIGLLSPDPAYTPQALAVALHAAGQHGPAYDAFVESLECRNDVPDGGYLAMGARLALDAGRFDHAESLVRQVLADRLAEPMSLSIGLEVAADLDQELHLLVASALHALVPSNPKALAAIATRLIRDGRRTEAASMLAPLCKGLDDECRYLLAVALHGHLRVHALLDALPRATPQSHRERAISLMIMRASEGEAWDAVTAALACAHLHGLEGPLVAAAACRAVRTWALRSASGAPIDVPRAWIAVIATILARHPADGQGRVRFIDLLGPDGLGEVAGLACVLPLLDSPGTGESCDPNPPFDVGSDADAAFVYRTLQERSHAHRVILAPKTLPSSMTPEQCRSLIRGGTALIFSLAHRPVLEQGDVDVALLVLEIALDAVHTVHDVRTAYGAALAVRLMSLVASSVAMHGHTQRARDLIEGALHVSAGCEASGPRCDAWLGFADVYHRCRHPLTAAIGLAIGSGAVPNDPERRRRFHSYAARITRDLGLIRIAREHYDAVLRISHAHPDVAAEREERGLRWSLTLANASTIDADANLSPEGLSELEQAAAESLNRLRDPNESPAERLVAGSYAAQICAILQSLRRAPPASSGDVENEVRLVSGGDFSALGGAALLAPTIGHIRQIMSLAVTARASEDAAADARLVRVLCRRFIGRADVDVSERAAILEAVADIEAAFLAPGERPQDGADNITARVFERARKGADINHLASILTQPSFGSLKRLDEALNDPRHHLEQLARVAVDGVLLEAATIVGERLARLCIFESKADWIVEGEEVFSGAALRAYSQQYPFAHHELEASAAHADVVVRSTMQGTGVSTVPPGTALRCLVLESRLLALPHNLQLIDDEFAGDVLATTQVPSLGWVLEARARSAELPWRASCWILRADAHDAGAALGVAGANLPELLEPRGVTVHTEVLLEDVKASPITWVVAHGGLGLDGLHLSRVSDERGVYHPKSAIVSACEGASLVVLLVCSGGRMSMANFEERVHGLPPALLRNGVKSVVASPWPMSVLVGMLWSDAFAAKMRAGALVADAVFEANRSLANRAPKDRLAMHLYGDPWLRVKDL